ncbi:MAG TPA: hypothetical protein VFG10_09455 [Saprospiraceae bacterium]|nr:hypothetical protein [Saprospiraceae bacterium]
MKFIQYPSLSFWILFIIVSCKTTVVSPDSTRIASDRMIVIDKEKVYSSEIIFNKEVTIYPEAFIATKGNGKIIFTKKVNIIGESQVFDDNVKVVFDKATISSLNPAWFGAKGYDEIDDTKAIRKTLQIARDYPNSINIEIPIGRFMISESIEIRNENPNSKSINILGKAMSASADAGSCFQWTGAQDKSMLVMSNNCLSHVEGMDFCALQGYPMKHNIELRPFDYQINFKNCSFSMCAGPGSANINLNNGNNAQVSEIQFENCVFRGYTKDNKTWETESAIIGGKANTKNFSFLGCSFLGYTVSAINIDISDILRVEHCTFALNEIDVTCMLCNTYASSNYSEQSRSFFKNGISANIAFTSLMNNYYDGSEVDDYFIRDGSGSLFLLNNNFGGSGGTDSVNKIKWNDNILSSIYSIGNFYRNNNKISNPFQTRNLRDQILSNITHGDKIGTDGDHVKLIQGN